MTNEELLGQIAKLLENQTLKFEDHILQLNLKIENDVAKRIDSLFDGYKLTHEKQWELERKVEALEKRIEQLEIRAS